MLVLPTVTCLVAVVFFHIHIALCFNYSASVSSDPAVIKTLYVFLCLYCTVERFVQILS